MTKYYVDEVERFISNINPEDVKRYSEYWDDLAPRSFGEYYSRWIFAFMSIHTTWARNVVGYKEVMALGTKFDWAQLQAAVERSKTGLTKMRTYAIWEFKTRYWNDPKWFYPFYGETLPECRNRLVGSTYGIGEAKTSFVLEMAFPMNCDVVCLDTHILQLYDYQKKGSPSKAVYEEMEKHWVSTCKVRDIPSPIARHIFWDGKQKQRDTRYWSYVLER